MTQVIRKLQIFVHALVMIDSLPHGQHTTLRSIAALDPRDQDLLSLNGRPLSLVRGQSLFRQGDLCSNLYLITEGIFKLERQSFSDDRTLIDLVRAGEALGITNMPNNSPQIHTVSAICLNDTKFLVFTNEFYTQVWTRNPRLVEFSTNLLRAQMLRMQENLCLQKLPLPARVAHFLTEVVNQNDRIRITRHEIANCVGASTEAVIRLLSIWTQNKLITTKDQQITIGDVEQLRLIWKN